MEEKIKRIINYFILLIFPILILFLITDTKYEQWSGIFVAMFIAVIFNIMFDIAINREPIKCDKNEQKEKKK